MTPSRVTNSDAMSRLIEQTSSSGRYQVRERSSLSTNLRSRNRLTSRALGKAARSVGRLAELEEGRRRLRRMHPWSSSGSCDIVAAVIWFEAKEG
jgi:hypothetical protein